MKKITPILFVILILLAWTSVGLCKEANDKALVYATQNRVFHKPHEVGFFAGYVADNDIYNPFPIGISYTFNKGYNFAWEVVRGEFMVNREKDLKGILENVYFLTPSEFTEPKYSIYSNFIWKPMYGKEAFRNKRILNHESYFLIGGGIAAEERLRPYEAAVTENSQVVSVGFGTKYFIGKNLCLNLEIRDLIKIKEDRTENNIYFGITLGWRFNLRARMAEEDQTIKKIKEYLNKDKSGKNEK